MNNLNFGVKAKDKITGFEGTVIGRCSYITGCTQWLVSPPVKNGNWQDSKWFDEGRLTVLGKKVITINDVSGNDNGCDIPAPTK